MRVAQAKKLDKDQKYPVCWSYIAGKSKISLPGARGFANAFSLVPRHANGHLCERASVARLDGDRTTA